MKKLYLFILFNVLISSCVAIRYFLVPGSSITLVGGIFSIFAVMSHFFALYLVLFLICALLLKINRNICYAVTVVIFSFTQITLYVDTIVFEQYRFHINQSMLSLVLSGQVVDFTLLNYLSMGLIIVLTVLIEYGIFFTIDKKLTSSDLKCQKKSRCVLLTTLFLILSLLISHFGHMVAFYYAYSPIMRVKEYIPLYRPLTSRKIMHLFDKDGERKIVYLDNQKQSSINYPKHDLIINPNKQKTPNILFIVLDSWRYDTFNEEVMPNTFQFVKQNQGVIFNQHYSTGNATRTGIFGLFYGIPGTYWDAFLRNSIPSLFITTLQKENYNIGIFTSAKVTAPEFDRNAFLTIENLRISSRDGSASVRDKQITEDWLNWYKQQDSNRPTFSFLFYDAPHAYDFGNDLDVKFKPIGDINYMALNNQTDPAPIFNRYKQSVYYDDHLMQTIYDHLNSTGALDNTIIIITGDHAQEMNDNKLGFWGHNGNYTDAQTKVPFIVLGAKETKFLKENIDNMTSHEDVVPSLMKHYLHVENNIEDYSTGFDLFSPMPERDWLLMSNYSSYAVKTRDSIYFVNRIGISHYMDSHNREINQTPNYQFVQDAMNKMRYFFETRK